MWPGVMGRAYSPAMDILRKLGWTEICFGGLEASEVRGAWHPVSGETADEILRLRDSQELIAADAGVCQVRDVALRHGYGRGLEARVTLVGRA